MEKGYHPTTDVPTHGPLLTLTQATKVLPPTGKGARVSVPTIWRWISKGLDGVHLNHLRMGRRIYVTEADLIDFGRQLARVHTDAADETPTAPPPARKGKTRTPEQRRAAADQALAEMGGRV